MRTRRRRRAGQLVLDPNALSPDGSVSLAHYAPSPDATLLAYACAAGRRRLGDHPRSRPGDRRGSRRRGARGCASPTCPGRATRAASSTPAIPSRRPHKVLEAALSGQAIYYHRLGTPQADDELIYRRLDHPVVDRERHGHRERLVPAHSHLSRRRQQQPAALPATGRRRPGHGRHRSCRSSRSGDAEYSPIGAYGSRIYLRSDKDAPNRRVIAIDLENPEPAAWKVVVPEQPQAIEEAALVGGRIIVHYLQDVQSRVRVFALDGKLEGDIALPGVGTVSSLEGRADAPDVWLGFSSPLVPATVYRCDPGDGASRRRSSRRCRRSTPPVRNPRAVCHLEGRHARAVLPDRAQGPRARRLAPDDDVRLRRLLDQRAAGYRPDVPAWLELGGIFVSVNLRGGAEYGETWHKAGCARAEAERVRRLHRRRRAPGPRELHAPVAAGHDGRLERRPAGRRGDGTAARPVRRGPAGRRRDGHAALRPLHRRQAVGHRVRLGVGSGAVRAT